MNLTDKQIEAAAKAMLERDACPIGIEHYLMLARAAAPFIQAQWEMPTEKECREFHNLTDRAIAAVLGEFVERRNASLLPKPVDPRREKVASAIESIKDHHRNQRLGEAALTTAEVADRVLAALDAKE